MRLSELLKYQTITIQCHDNPDADAIAAGYALYCFFTDKECDVQLVYSGKNQINKANLKLLVEKLSIPIEYIPTDYIKKREGLLITVDCQYGAGNVTYMEADKIAVIDHHPIEMENPGLYRIEPTVGSCATLAWSMLVEEGYPVNEDVSLGTALYYALYMDTNQFSELFNPMDMNMRERLTFNKRLISQFRNANLSLEELEIAGIAMLRYNYNEDYRFAVIKAQPCDPNILGLISDFLLQVAEIDTCVVYNEINDGFKFSVRSCVKEVNANELAAFLAKDIGSGGGHFEKAGGFISIKLYEKLYPMLHSEAYFSNKMIEYHDMYSLVYADQVNLEIERMKQYQRKDAPIRYVRLSDIVPIGDRVTIHGRSDTWDWVSEEDLLFLIERNGDIYPFGVEQFRKYLEPTDEEDVPDYYHDKDFTPIIKDWTNDSIYLLDRYVKICRPKDTFKIYAKRMDRDIKLFPVWDGERYLIGNAGDYMAITTNDLTNIYVVAGNAFFDRYEEI
ncbi:MAG: DHH family phosphoesterase [Acetatifactor sp.]|nr:DHH family phosphoesterase [Acetatifactor sp.]